MEHTDVLLKAKDELQAIEGQLTALAARRSKLQDFIATYQSLMGVSASSGGAERTGQVEGAVSAPESSSKTAKATILGAVTAILRRGQPKTTKQLVQELEAQGVQIGGADKASNLAAMLSREKQMFHNVRGLGYSLAETGSPKVEAAGAGTPAASGVWLDPSNAPSSGTATAAD